MTSDPTPPNHRELRLAIAGGGTGGHVSPAVATLEELRRRGPVRALWIGSRHGVEEQAARDLGVPFYAVRVGKLRRYLSLETPLDAARIPLGVWEAWRILRGARPAVVFSTGGFVSVPAVVAARLLAIPALTHEQTAYLGLATKINARCGAVVALSFPSSASGLGAARDRAVVTGNPVRAAVLGGNAARVTDAFQLTRDLPLIYVTGGAQGAHALNEAVLGALDALLPRSVIIHQCGPNAGNGDFQRAERAAAALPGELRTRYRPVETVRDELGDIYAAASLVISRAGAGTVNELATLGLPAMLVPLPSATEQRLNAEQLVKTGAAVMLPQTELTPERLTREALALLGDPERLARMRRAGGAAGHSDAAAQLADEIERLAAPYGAASRSVSGTANGGVDRLA